MAHKATVLPLKFMLVLINALFGCLVHQ